MARLNDPPSHPAGQHAAPPSSSSTTMQDIDALKRRFTRQNRELARTNSAQSLRIRNLEAEIARLLAENIALREAAIAAQREAEKWQRQRHVAGEVVAMKERLERKLAEVSVLVQELGVLGVGDNATARKRRSGGKEDDEQKRGRLSMEGGNAATAGAGVESPDQKDWRNRQTLGGVLINGTMASGLEQEGRLPPIVEDKLYPRRTLEPMEIQALNDKGSPDIGPPPVAQFDAIDRGSWGEAEVQESPRRTANDATTGELQIVALPNNLETRRKRRTSSLLSEMTRPSAAASDAPALFKSSAKRKLEVSELDEPAPPVDVEMQSDDFVYQRRPTLKAAGRKSGRFSRLNGHHQGDIIIPAAGERSPQKDQAKGTERRVLAPKSNNSPTKKKSTDAAADLKSLKGNKDGIDDSDDTRDIPARPRVSVVRSTSNTTLTNAAKQRRQQAQASKSKRESGHHDSSGNDKAADSDTQPPPKTPFSAADAVLSPPSTSTEPPSSKHNPRGAQQQEAALINSVEDVLNGSIGRGSRRARAAVSYAEPNLRDKMRRPGKELVSAVEGIDRQKHREASIGESAAKAEGQSTLPNAMNVAMSNMRLKEEPASPLSDKKKPSTIINNDSTGEADSAGAGAGAVKGKKNERTSAAKGRTDDHNHHHHHNQVSDSVTDAVLAKEIDRLAIFDPPTSSSDNSSPMEPKRPGPETATMTTTGAGASRPSRPLSRRQSVAHSVSNEALVHRRKGGGSATALRQADSGEEATTGSGPDRLATRRRSMMI